ncbi:hypothetical protein TIFTF001_024462 [Ficus carica]|uniref:Uncharacterized protein n=1 Tax=Ficus carica TaxID=3494 RepID=A0AA88APX5_FICCA|nr:hypothetical protein TIFTF001_024462 [Ficus carica]
MIIISQSSEEAAITRASDCKTHCGDVKVPLPVGIGLGCSIDGEQFEIVYNKSTTTHTPFLRKLEVQLLNISTDQGTLRVTNHLASQNCTVLDIKRKDFPDDFIFGLASSAYQYEGATNVGRGASIWDTFTEKYPEKIKDGSSGKVADEFYYLYQSDIVDRLKGMGVDSFRFSISWSRILPYRFILSGYEDGHLAPGRCSRYAGHCTNGNSAKEPYLAMHYLLLAHAKAVDLYRKQYKVEQNGIVGITLQVTWMIPKFHTYESCLAAYRGLDFLTGWILHPITFGDYPETVKSLVGCRLPKFTEDESKLLIGSIDFLGVNYYAATYAEESNISCIMNQGPSYDNRVNLTISRHSLRIGEQITGTEIFVYPKGIEEVVMYIKENYNNPIMYITENGINDPDFPDPQDTVRIEYHKKHLCYLLQAIKLGAKVKGYFAWTFLDNFEWSSGYTKKYGFYRVDRKSMARTAKASVRWFTDFLKPVPKFVNYEEPAYSLLSAA